MNEAVFSQVAMLVFLTGLIVWMGFIVWDLAKKSQAGKFGTIALFTVLGAGVVGFLVKTVLVEIMHIRPFGRHFTATGGSRIILLLFVPIASSKDSAPCGSATPGFSDLPSLLISPPKHWKRSYRPMLSNRAAPRKPTGRAGYRRWASTAKHWYTAPMATT